MTEGIQILLISQAFASLAALIGIYLNIRLKLKELELRVTAVESQDRAIMKKLDQIANNVQDIKIEMQNKLDRD
jgi:hypothetical protein